jgi:hypothetical protein
VGAVPFDLPEGRDRMQVCRLTTGNACHKAHISMTLVDRRVGKKGRGGLLEKLADELQSAR